MAMQAPFANDDKVGDAIHPIHAQMNPMVATTTIISPSTKAKMVNIAAPDKPKKPQQTG
jgi:hypothetical protein